MANAKPGMMIRFCRERQERSICTICIILLLVIYNLNEKKRSFVLETGAGSDLWQAVDTHMQTTDETVVACEQR